jgi:hypothetical protein
MRWQDKWEQREGLYGKGSSISWGQIGSKPIFSCVEQGDNTMGDEKQRGEGAPSCDGWKDAPRPVHA